MHNVSASLGADVCVLGGGVRGQLCSNACLWIFLKCGIIYVHLMFFFFFFSKLTLSHINVKLDPVRPI